ncbi:IS66 family transposase [Acidaminococcus fermentans]|uniref:IS66 family transposase n=1 Tax=Acidaminococcus fermentans TaxID=905 RepID=UPI003F89C17F
MSSPGNSWRDNQGSLQTDGYAEYEKVLCRVHALCWVHVWWKFIEAIPADMPREGVAQTTCGQAIQYILLQRKQLSAYLEYGEAALTNNICERAIRNCSNR